MRRAPSCGWSAGRSPTRSSPARYRLAVEFHLLRPRTGEKVRTLGEIIELTTRAAHEQELFPPGDWEFIQWLAETHARRRDGEETLVLSDLELLHWLARWGHTPRLELAAERRAAAGAGVPRRGRRADAAPGKRREGAVVHAPADRAGRQSLSVERGAVLQPPPAAGAGGAHVLPAAQRAAAAVLEHWASQPAVPVRKLSHRLLMHLRKTQSSHGVDWEQLCVAHAAKPQFIFELLDETVRLRLLARSQRDQSLWLWNGHEWQLHEAKKPRPAGNKPEILDDPRLEPATQWLRRLDWFTPEPGLWVGDANEDFLEPARARLGRPARRRPSTSATRLPPPVPGAAPAAPAARRQGQRHRLAGRLRRMGAGRA